MTLPAKRAPSPLPLDAADVVTAAIGILGDHGLDAVSMRTVAARLGVSPFPLYSRIGSKDALLDAMAERLLADLDPRGRPTSRGPTTRADGRTSCGAACGRCPTAGSSWAPGAGPTSTPSAPLVAALRHDGVGADDAVRACRLLMWSTIGFVVTESGSDVSGAEADALFEQQIDYLLAGLTSDAG